MEKKTFAQLSELLSVHIDNNSLDENLDLKHALENDSGLQKEYDKLIFIKTLVQNSKQKSSVIPDTVRLNVMNAIEMEQEKTTRSQTITQPSWWESVMRGFSGFTQLQRFAFAFFLFIVAPVSIYFSITTMSLQGNQQAESYASMNFFNVSFNNYSSVCSGKITPDIKTNSFEQLSRFFAEKGVYYNIIRPETSAELVGGIITERQGIKVAHLVFSSNDTLVYMHQAPQNLFDMHALDVMPDAQKLLENGEWYWEESSDTHVTLAAWKKDSVVCSVVADVPAWRLFQIVH